MSSTRIRWTPEEQKNLTTAVLELHKIEPKTSLLKHVKQAQTDLFDVDRRRNLAVVPDFIKAALKPSRKRASTKRKRRLASAATRTTPKAQSLSVTLDSFSTDELTAELGKRLVKQAMIDFALKMEG